MRKYLGGRIKGQQRLWMDAHFRGDIDDQPPPPKKEKTYIKKFILYVLITSYPLLWMFVTIPFNHAWKNQPGHLSEENINRYCFFIQQ